jgi:hypothetical protein
MVSIRSPVPEEEIDEGLLPPADILRLALIVDKFTRDAKRLSADMRLMQLFFEL